MISFNLIDGVTIETIKFTKTQIVFKKNKIKYVKLNFPRIKSSLTFKFLNTYVRLLKKENKTSSYLANLFIECVSNVQSSIICYLFIMLLYFWNLLKMRTQIKMKTFANLFQCASKHSVLWWNLHCIKSSSSH